MHVTEGMKEFRVHWEDMSGNKNYYFDEGFNKEEVLTDAEGHIKRMYMASFSVVGLEERIDRSWTNVAISTKYYKGK